MGNLSKHIGKRIRSIRKNRGWTQAKLAELTGLEPTTIARIEGGLNFPKEENLETIANILGIEVVDLFCHDEIEEDKQILIIKTEKTLQLLSPDKVKTAYKIIKTLAT